MHTSIIIEHLINSNIEFPYPNPYFCNDCKDEDYDCVVSTLFEKGVLPQVSIYTSWPHFDMLAKIRPRIFGDKKLIKRAHNGIPIYLGDELCNYADDYVFDMLSQAGYFFMEILNLSVD